MINPITQRIKTSWESLFVTENPSMVSQYWLTNGYGFKSVSSLFSKGADIEHIVTAIDEYDVTHQILRYHSGKVVSNLRNDDPRDIALIQYFACFMWRSAANDTPRYKEECHI